jgi:hypothetical protein
LLGSLAGAAATYLIGFLGDKYNVKKNPALAGYLITGFVLFSYVSCCPMFLLASKEYEKEINKQKDKKAFKMSQHQNYGAGKEDENFKPGNSVIN